LGRFIWFSRTPPWTDGRIVQDAARAVPYAIFLRVAVSVWALSAGEVYTPPISSPETLASNLAGGAPSPFLASIFQRILQAHVLPHTFLFLCLVIYSIIRTTWVVVTVATDVFCPHRISLEEADLRRHARQFRVTQSVPVDARARSNREQYHGLPLSEIIPQRGALSDLLAYDPRLHPVYRVALLSTDDSAVHEV
jgi:hypothetical protein